MYTMKNYVAVNSLEEAYALRLENRMNMILGGNLWQKMGSLSINTGIDLCNLGLNHIEETEDEYIIGCMCSLRDIETHQSLNKEFNNAFKEATRHIVGVQFRNTATIGGSVFPRYGFSDVLTVFASVDTYVELYKGGLVHIRDFLNMRMDNDILVKLHVKKDSRKVSYQSHRMTETDFGVLTCAVMKKDGLYSVVLGATPAKAKLVEGLTIPDVNDDHFDEVLESIVDQYRFGNNNRGSAPYRRAMAKVLIKRALVDIHR